MLSKKKPFIGSAMMNREGLVDENRASLVGLHSLSGQAITGGSHIVMNAELAEPATSLGHVTAACYSPTLGKYVALALVHKGPSMIGTRAYATDPLRGRHVPVEIRQPPHGRPRRSPDAWLRPFPRSPRSIVPGEHGNIADGVGVVLTETRPGSIAQVAAWPGKTAGLLAAIAKVTGLKLPDGAGAGMHEDGKSAFGFAPGRFLVADQAEGLVERLADAIGSDIGTVTGLSHGRTVFRIAGNGDATEGGHKVDSAEWVLGKLFALDFALPPFRSAQAARRCTTTSTR